MFGLKGELCFEPEVTLSTPYNIAGLSVFLEKYKILNHSKQAQKLCTQLMKSLTNDNLLTFVYYDLESAKDVIKKKDDGQLLYQNRETQDLM